MVRINGADLQNVLFVGAALSKDKKCGGVMTRILIDQEGDSLRAVANDGYRLHLATLEADYPCGVYEVVKMNSKEIILELDTDAGDYPDYRHVILADSILTQCAGGTDGLMHAYAKTIRAIPEPQTIDFNYFKDAYSTLDVYHQPGVKGTPVVFKSGARTAVVMPMRG